MMDASESSVPHTLLDRQGFDACPRVAFVERCTPSGNVEAIGRALSAPRGATHLLAFFLFPSPRRPRVCACNHELLFSTYGPVVGRAFCAGTVSC